MLVPSAPDDLLRNFQINPVLSIASSGPVNLCIAIGSDHFSNDLPQLTISSIALGARHLLLRTFSPSVLLNSSRIGPRL
jgi:hypothetical protein